MYKTCGHVCSINKIKIVSIKKYAHTQENYMYIESVRQCSFVRSYFIFTLLLMVYLLFVEIVKVLILSRISVLVCSQGGIFLHIQE